MKKLFIILVFVCTGFMLSVAQKPSELKGDLIIFHAGSLSVPMKEIKAEFSKVYPGVNVLLEPAGSVECARKITDLKKPCDIIASSDYKVIDKMLIPGFTGWGIRFAANEMSIAFTEKARYGNKITPKNWYEILMKSDVVFSRADPNSDPCGYRSLMTMQLAEIYYRKPGLARQLSAKDNNYIRPKEVDLLALIESGNVDFIFLYKSVAVQHKLKYITLPDEVNLRNPGFSESYQKAVVEISGKEPGKKELMKGEPMIYGVTILDNAPNKQVAIAFLEFMLSKNNGMKIMENDGQPSVIPSPATGFDKIPVQLQKFAKNIR